MRSRIGKADAMIVMHDVLSSCHAKRATHVGHAAELHDVARVEALAVVVSIQVDPERPCTTHVEPVTRQPSNARAHKPKRLCSPALPPLMTMSVALRMPLGNRSSTVASRIVRPR